MSALHAAHISSGQQKDYLSVKGEQLRNSVQSLKKYLRTKKIFKIYLNTKSFLAVDWSLVIILPNLNNDLSKIVEIVSYPG